MEYTIAETNRLGNRQSNQDRFTAISNEGGVLLVLGDGMGGIASGDVAAELLVEAAERLYLESRSPIADPNMFFHRIILEAHEMIARYGMEQHPPVHPGTTAVLCLVEQGHAIWAHAGDSRLYIFHEGLPIYRTVDHSLVEELYQRGEISRYEQETHPKRNQITRCLGCQITPPRITVSNRVKLQQHDVILLCSDGLWGGLDDVQMGAVVAGDELQSALDTLAETAEFNSYPSSDNISAIALRLLSESEEYVGRTDEMEQQQTGHTDDVRSAIDQIEAVLREYQDEINK